MTAAIRKAPFTIAVSAPQPAQCFNVFPTVSGTTTDSCAGVTSNGVMGTVASDAFTVLSVPLVESQQADVLTRSADWCGNTATDDRKVIYDVTPPAVTIGGFTDGQITSQSVTPTWTATDVNLVASGATLSVTTGDRYQPRGSADTTTSAPFASGTAESADGDYVLAVTGADCATNASALTKRFTVDKTPPRITFAGVTDQQQVRDTAVSPTFTVGDRNLDPSTVAATLTFTPAGGGAPQTGGFASGTALSAAGSYAITVTASDKAGNAASGTVQFTIAICGDGIVEPGEACETGACCAACDFLADGSACPSTDLCFSNHACQAGICTGNTPVEGCQDTQANLAAGSPAPQTIAAGAVAGDPGSSTSITMAANTTVTLNGRSIGSVPLAVDGAGAFSQEALSLTGLPFGVLPVASYHLEPSGAQFSPPLTFTMTFDPSLAPNPEAWLCSDDGTTCEQLDATLGTVDVNGVAQTELTVPVAHFSWLLLAQSFGDHPRSSGAGLDYTSAPVMVGTVNAYIIWYGTWTDTQKAILGDLVGNLRGSPYQNIITTYKGQDIYGNGHTLDDVRLNGQASDTGESQGAALTDDKIGALVKSWLPQFTEAPSVNGDPNGIYLVLASSDVTATSLSHGVTFCSTASAWASYTNTSTAMLNWAFVGNPNNGNPDCLKYLIGSPTTKSPNGDIGADSMASSILFMLADVITNYQGAWYHTADDSQHGYPCGSMCAGQYGTLYTSGNGAQANVRIGARDYVVQENWVVDSVDSEGAATGHCALQYGQGALKGNDNGGSNPYWLQCPSGQVAVGIYGQASNYVDQLGLICAPLDSADGTLGAVDPSTVTGKNTGSPYSVMCPTGQAMVGITGRSGTYVDHLGIQCQYVPTWLASGTVGPSLDAGGGPGGDAFTETCPQGHVINQISGYSGDWIDAVQPQCVMMYWSASPNPPGSYEGTCGSCSVSEDSVSNASVLTCKECDYPAGCQICPPAVTTTLTLPCAGDIASCSGKLTCGLPVPSGPYQSQGCSSCSVDACSQSLTCACNGNGNIPTWSQVPLPCGDANGINNCGGKLTCGACAAPPPTASLTLSVLGPWPNWVKVDGAACQASLSLGLSNVCTYTFPLGATVTLQPDGNGWGGWTGNCLTDPNAAGRFEQGCTLTMNANKTESVIYPAQLSSASWYTLNLTVNGTVANWVTVDGNTCYGGNTCTYLYDSTASPSLTAQLEDDGNAWNGWTGNCLTDPNAAGQFSQYCNLTMSGNKSVVVTYP